MEKIATLTGRGGPVCAGLRAYPNNPAARKAMRPQAKCKKAMWFWGFFSADEEATKAVHPTVRAFHHPAAGAEARFSFERDCFFTPGADVGGEAKLGHDVTHVLVVIAFVQTPPLGGFGGGFGARHPHAFQGFAGQLQVMSVGTGHRQAHRHAVPLGQQAALDSGLAAIRRMGTGFFPRRAGPWSSPRPSAARPRRSLATRQTARCPLARGPETPPLPPPPGTDRAPLNARLIRSDPGLAMGSPCAARRRWQPRRLDPVDGDARRQNDACSLAPAAAVPTPPIRHLKPENPWSSGCSAGGHAFAWRKVLCSFAYSTRYSDRL